MNSQVTTNLIQQRTKSQRDQVIRDLDDCLRIRICFSHFETIVHIILQPISY